MLHVGPAPHTLFMLLAFVAAIACLTPIHIRLLWSALDEPRRAWHWAVAIAIAPTTTVGTWFLVHALVTFGLDYSDPFRSTWRTAIAAVLCAPLFHALLAFVASELLRAFAGRELSHKRSLLIGAASGAFQILVVALAVLLVSRNGIYGQLEFQDLRPPQSATSRPEVARLLAGYSVFFEDSGELVRVDGDSGTSAVLTRLPSGSMGPLLAGPPLGSNVPISVVLSSGAIEEVHNESGVRSARPTTYLYSPREPHAVSFMSAAGDARIGVQQYGIAPIRMRGASAMRFSAPFFSRELGGRPPWFVDRAVVLAHGLAVLEVGFEDPDDGRWIAVVSWNPRAIVVLGRGRTPVVVEHIVP